MTKKKIVKDLIELWLSSAEVSDTEFWSEVVDCYQAERLATPDQELDIADGLKALIRVIALTGASKRPSPRDRLAVKEHGVRIELYRQETINFFVFLGEGNLLSQEQLNKMIVHAQRMRFSPLR